VRRPIWLLPLVCLAVAAPAYGDLVERPRQPPPPDTAECGGDRIVGTWRATKWLRGWHNVRTMQIRRAGGDQIEGRIVGLWWDGAQNQRRPPPCAPYQTAYQVSEPSRGHFIGGDRVSFRAASYRIDRAICGSPPSVYNLDHFTGTLDPRRAIIRAVNNDGRAARNDDYVFRRVSCR
jgi:hypothetical protein